MQHKVRDVEAACKKAGLVPARCRGSHLSLAAPSGRVIVLKVNHRGEPVTANVLASVRRFLRQENETALSVFEAALILLLVPSTLLAFL